MGKYRITCRACGHEFIAEFEDLGYGYITGTCCEVCGRDIEIQFNELMEMSTKTHGIDKQFK